MQKVIVNILSALVMQGCAMELASSHASSAKDVMDKLANKSIDRVYASTDNLVDSMVDTMFDRVLKKSSIHHIDMDNTMLGKPAGMPLVAATMNSIQKTLTEDAKWKHTKFWGPIANWGLVGAAVYDASCKGPEIIDLSMTGTMIGYSSLFMGFAWQVEPRSKTLFSCHLFNVLAQCNQMRRAVDYKLSNSKEAAAEIMETGKKLLVGAVAAGAYCAACKPMKIAMFVNRGLIPTPVRKVLTHPAGPLTVFFWAPASKWLFSINNIKDINKPTDTISAAQMAALTLTGLIWMRYSFTIKPVNLNLAAVNVALGSSSGYHLGRKIHADYFSEDSQQIKENKEKFALASKK